MSRLEERRAARSGAVRVAALLRRWGIVIVLGVLAVAFESAEPAFGHLANLLSVLQGVSVTTLLGIGVTLTLAVGGFDLSVGSAAAFCMMTASYAQVVLGLSALPTVLLTLAVGGGIGLLNGLLIVRLRVPDLLATLGTGFLLVGLQLIPTGGHSITTGMTLPSGETAHGVFDPAFLAIGRARLAGVPVPVLLTALLVLLAWAAMERTRWGRVLYAVGGNETAARLAGAPTGQYRVAAYVASSMLAALGGIVLAARVGRGDTSAGTSLLLDAVAAALIGFAVLDARRPAMLGTAFGAVFVGVLLNGLTMLNAPYYTQDFVKGAVLVAALAMTFGLGRETR